MTKILIVDDHPLVRAGFAQLIGDCPDLEVCGEAADMAEALKQIEVTSPQLAKASRNRPLFFRCVSRIQSSFRSCASPTAAPSSLMR